MTAAGTITEGTILSQRQLNRTLLARQLLQERSAMTPRDALEHLVGLQSQNPNDSYIVLWTRLRDFLTDDLSRMMLDRTAVRASLMRGTIHLVSRNDYLRLFPFTYPLHERALPRLGQGRELDPQQIPEIVEAGRELLRDTPMTIGKLGDELVKRWPEVPRGAMAQACRFLLPLVQTTPRGVWGASHQATWALAEEWLGEDIPVERAPDDALRRYLAAFGPATVADMQAWSGLTGLRAHVERMRDDLVTYRNERGQELFDLPGSLIADGSSPAPVRFLPVFDNVLLSHKDRTRIITEERRKAIGTRNGLFQSTYLVDGFVAGSWEIAREKERVALVLTPFEPHSRETLRDLEAEGDRLLAYVTGADQREVIVASQ